MTHSRVHVGGTSRPLGWGIITLAAIALLTGCTAATTADDAAPATQSSRVATPSPSQATPEAVDSGPTPAATPTSSQAPDSGPTEAPDLPVVEGKLDEDVELPTGVSVSVTSVRATSVKAETPGETSGPAVKVVVAVTNDSEDTYDVDSAVVALYTPDGELGIPTLAGGTDVLSGTLKPGAETRGTYVFMLDPAKGRDIIVSVNYAAGEPVAEFTGRSS